MLKEQWEKIRVQRVVNYWNKRHGTHLRIKGRAEDVYPALKGQLNWDWVCNDTQVGDEFAVEVKRITDQKAEEKSHILWQLLTEVQNNLNKNRVLQGSFHLSSGISMSFNLPLSRNNKKELKEVLYNVILTNSQTLEVGKEKGLTSQIQKQLSFALPEYLLFTLHKISTQGNQLSKGTGTTVVGSINFDELELEEFRQLVIHANEQLGKSNPRKTFLVIIEEGFRHKDSVALTEAFTKITADCYSNINNVYFVRGKEVAEVSLPNSP